MEKRDIANKINIFTRFLKEHNIYSIYMQNLQNSRHNSIRPRIFFNNTTIKSFISRAFRWESTPQGIRYWSYINDEWVDYVEILRSDLNT